MVATGDETMEHLKKGGRGVLPDRNGGVSVSQLRRAPEAVGRGRIYRQRYFSAA